jgi:tetratricopeptide (TPR) repeat protein
MRLGYVAGQEGRRDQAVAAFAEAERLFTAASNDEGLTEVLTRRGAMFDALGEYKSARTDLERARTSAKSDTQRIRASLGVADILVAEGRPEEAIRTASRAVEEATRARLDTVAADGLIDLATTLAAQGRSADGRAHLARAMQLAEQRGARRIAVRAKLQLASFDQFDGRAADALRQVNEVLPFVHQNHYRRLELTALGITSRAHQQLDALDEARRESTEMLQVAEGLRDEDRIALAVSNLASVTTALGDYPAALVLRERSERIRRAQNDASTLPYELLHHADLLIRMGRATEATPLLEEAVRRTDGTSQLGNRVAFLNGLAAATQFRCKSALAYLTRIKPSDNPADSAHALGPAIESFCTAAIGVRRQPNLPSDVTPALAREQCYWIAAALQAQGKWAEADAEARRGLLLLGTISNPELAWRLAAVAAASERQQRRAANDVHDRAQTELSNLEKQWVAAAPAYLQRPDLYQLRTSAGLQ